MGLDDGLREIYVIGCGTHGKMLNRIYNGFNTIYNIEESIHFIKAHIGEWVPRFLVVLSMQFPSLKPIIRHLFIIWYKKMYPLWFKIVQREKEKLIKGKSYETILPLFWRRTYFYNMCSNTFRIFANGQGPVHRSLIRYPITIKWKTKIVEHLYI